MDLWGEKVEEISFISLDNVVNLLTMITIADDVSKSIIRGLPILLIKKLL